MAIRLAWLAVLAAAGIGGGLAQAPAAKPESSQPSQTADPATRQQWKAQWISHPTAPLREPIVLHFRKAITLAAAPAHFVVHVSADNRFVLYVNGTRAGDGPARGDLAHWRYETYDLAPMLHAGANTIAATVWNFGVYSPVAQMSDRTAFLVQGDTAAESAADTDWTWQVEVEPGQEPLPRRRNGLWAYMASGPGEAMHADQYDWDWMTDRQVADGTTGNPPHPPPIILKGGNRSVPQIAHGGAPASRPTVRPSQPSAPGLHNSPTQKPSGPTLRTEKSGKPTSVSDGTTMKSFVGNGRLRSQERWVHAGPALRESSIYDNAGTAAPYGKQADVPWALVADTLPHMAYASEDAGHVVRNSIADAEDFPKASVIVKPNSYGHILLDRGELTTGYPRLKFSAGKLSKITLTYAEALYDEEMHKGNRNEVLARKAVGVTDEIYPDGGVGRVFEPLWWRTWRYVDIEVETKEYPLILNGLDAEFSAFPFEVKASFTSSDPDLDKIWKIGWHTVQLDAHETYMDTPYYEQLQYAGDTRLQALITYATTGDDRLPRQAIRALDDSRIPIGITASRYPSQLPQYIPTFSLLWIGLIHDNYEYRTDTAFVKSMLPGTRTVLDWFAGYQHADGLLGKVPWWSFIDWVETKKDFPSYDRNGESCLTTLEYIGALEDAIDLEGALGEHAYIEMDEKRLAAAKTGVMAQCWDEKAGLVADSPAKEIFSKHANMLAVLHDVIPHDQQTALMRKVIAHEVDGTAAPGEMGLSSNPIDASYYFRYYQARALEHAGLGDEYLKTLGSWHEFLTMGFTTWPEQPGDTRSDSHAWSAHPTFDLLTLVAGIAPGSPGFRTVRIAPHLGGLTHVEASYPHALGMIHVKYADGRAEVELPQGLTGEFVWAGKRTPIHEGKTTLPMR